MTPRPNIQTDGLLKALDQEWLAGARESVAAKPESVTRHFASAGRRAGRAPLPDAPGWTADEAARAVLLAALPPDAVAGQVADLYRYGDADEKRAVLKALPLLPLGAEAVPLLHDAIRTNDTRLVAAALGPYAGHLDQTMWRQAVLKCVFMGVPLAAVDRLEERADAELAGMLAAFAEERTAAGRPTPDDATALLDRLTGEKPGDPTGEKPDRPTSEKEA
ncbi:EboA domain-containing protein [Streptosporangium sp. NPDC023963]|uniref:EboA domain-containing protein n=1 Tax=Streptosporangium sp. NPDC023963 TaxID=3155608 RepID=UPI003449D5BF